MIEGNILSLAKLLQIDFWPSAVCLVICQVPVEAEAVDEEDELRTCDEDETRSGKTIRC